MRLSKRILSMIIVAALCMTMVFGCGAATGGSIQLTQEACSILEGETRKIIALTDEESKVSWASSDECIVSVVDGEIIGKKEGTATITASVGKTTAECVVTVGKDTTPEIYIASKNGGYYLEIGDEDGIQTNFVLCTRDGEGNVTEEEAPVLTYQMYNKGIASIGQDGVIMPLEIGPTTLTVSSGDLSCTVDVIVCTKLINSTKDWLEVLGTTDNLEAYYYVMNDLDFQDVKYNGPGTTVEKEAGNCFRGTIDGGNHVIKNISLNSASGYHGIFGSLLDAKVKNLSFENVTLTAGGTIVNGCGLAPSISGHGSTFENVFIDLQYAKKASGNSCILAGEIDGAGSFDKCLITVTSPSGDTVRDGIKVAGSCSEKAKFKNLVILCQGATPTEIPEGVQIFTDRMEAIWALNSGKLMGSDWTYSVTDIPQLGKE